MTISRGRAELRTRMPAPESLVALTAIRLFAAPAIVITWSSLIEPEGRNQVA